MASAELAVTVMGPAAVAVTALLDSPLLSVTVDALSRLPADVVQLMVAPTMGALDASFNTTTSGDEAKAQPMIASARLCAQFFAMACGGVLWGKGGAPGAVEADSAALAAARRFFVPAQTG